MTGTAFTVGLVEGYDSYLADPPEAGFWKVGQHDDYRGGWVWATPEMATAFLESAEFARAFPGCSGRFHAEFAVYRLELPVGWDADVFAEPDEDGVHHLRNDARIVERVA